MLGPHRPSTQVLKSFVNERIAFKSYLNKETINRMSTGVLSVYTDTSRAFLDVAASKYSIASLKETQGDLEGARRLFLECEQIYPKVLGADHEETLDAAMRALTVGEEKEEEEGG